MTSLDSINSPFDGVSGGKIKNLSDGATSSPSKARNIIEGTIFIAGIGGTILAGLFGITIPRYDFSSSEYVGFFDSHITVFGWIGFATILASLVAACIVCGIGEALALTFVSVIGFFLFVIGGLLANVIFDSIGGTHSGRSLESWIATNEGLAIYQTGEDAPAISLADDRSFTLIDGDGKLVQGMFTEESENKYVFSRIPLQSKDD
jgi:hypothetical protein